MEKYTECICMDPLMLSIGANAHCLGDAVVIARNMMNNVYSASMIITPYRPIGQSQKS